MVENLVQRLRVFGRLLAQLPPSDCRRWTALRKFQVVNAVRAGALAPQTARERYGISMEELRDWLLKEQLLGHSALRVTRPRTDFRRNGAPGDGGSSEGSEPGEGPMTSDTRHGPRVVSNESAISHPPSPAKRASQQLGTGSLPLPKDNSNIPAESVPRWSCEAPAKSSDRNGTWHQYEFIIVDEAGVERREVFTADDDEAAVQRSLQIRHSSSVQVWRDGRKIRSLQWFDS